MVEISSCPYFTSGFAFLPCLRILIGLTFTSIKFEFSFISDILPDVSSVFYINGQYYLCEKLTATFTESGMSQKIKGSFWRII